MRSSQPPPAATWLLKRLCGSNEALAGDLAEEYQHGRSDAWYWRQVLIAVLVSGSSDIRMHKLFALRAVVIGWTALMVFTYLITLPLNRLYWLTVAAFGGPRVNLWWRHYYTLPLLFVPCIAGFLSGWLVARFHRARRVAMVFMYVITVLLVAVPEFLRLATDSLTNVRFLPYLLALSLSEGLFVVSILFGGLRSADTASSLH